MLQYIDSFDAGDLELKWLVMRNNATSAVPAMDALTPFGRGRSIKFPSDGLTVEGALGANPSMRAFHPVPSPASELFIGFNFRWQRESQFTAPFFTVLNIYTDGGSSKQLLLNLLNTGTLQLVRGDGAVLGSSRAASFLQKIWYFIELHVVLGGSGSAEVRVDEKPIIDFSGATTSGGNGLAAMIGLNATVTPSLIYSMPSAWYDDLYIADASGAHNNAYLGMGEAYSLMPDGPGVDTHLTPVGSPSNWDNVNDVPWSASDYNSSSTPGDRDLYSLDDLPANVASVAGVQTVITAEATAATVRLKAALRSGGTVYYDPTVTLDGTPSDVSVVLRETDPATSSLWTRTAVNALQAGVEITS